MSVETEVLYAAIAFLAASWRDVMIDGPGKMCALTIGAHRTIESVPPAYCCWTVSGEEDGQLARNSLHRLGAQDSHTPNIAKLAILKHEKLFALR